MEEKKSKKRTKTLVKIGCGVAALLGCEYLYARGTNRGITDIPQMNVDIIKKVVNGLTTLTPKETLETSTSSIEVEQVEEAPVVKEQRRYYNNYNNKK